MKEPFWITAEAAIAFHERQLSEHGGRTGVRDMTLLESALAKPQNVLAYSEGKADLATLAASYAYGIATNRPFVDGNKRTALAVSFVFVELNGATMIATEPDAYAAFLALAAGEVPQEELTVWFQRNMKILEE